MLSLLYFVIGTFVVGCILIDAEFLCEDAAKVAGGMEDEQNRNADFDRSVEDEILLEV
ncbi:MAG TPA: hypothetical protein VGZ22_16395 [Isosphaeraceae bacterium]|jgi:hypothetical protein|nr:hypothetical protein [Isosphaeraceae bacterium]